MGSMGASGMADAINEGNVTLRLGLEWHLTSNHFPPLPAAWVDGAIAAIEAGLDEDWGREITLPESGRFAEQVHTAGDLIEAMHLDAYLWVEENDYPEENED